ncbi:MAG: metal ABC transporter solute-binding protein, Zn/Mn family, partial [Paracoccaceae bacterium]
DDHAGHDHGAFDPHAWLSLENAVIYANNIAAGLAQADPENAGDYYANRATFISEIETLSADIEAMMKSLPADKRTVVTPHDAFGYFAATYDLTFVAPQGMSTESEASAGDVAALITQIREDSISAVFIESITDNRMMEQIANETGATIGGTLYSDALSAQSGPASTYLDMMRHNATTLFDALGN